MALLGAYGWDASNGHDDSGGGHDAVPAGSLAFTTGKSGSGKALSASGDSNVNAATIAGIGPTSAITVSGWFKRTSGNYHHLLAARPDSGGSEPAAGLWGGDSGDSKPSFAVGSVAAKSPTTMDTAYHYIAGTYDGTTVKLYIDNTTTPVATAARTGAIPTYGAGGWCLFNVASGAGYWSNTDVDDFRIYDSALDSTALAADKATSVGATGGSPLTATVTASPTSVNVGSTSTLAAVASGGTGTSTYVWSALAGAVAHDIVSGQGTATLVVRPTAAGSLPYRLTIAKGSETITRDTTVTAVAPGSTTGVVAVRPGLFTKQGAGSDVAVQSDADPTSGHRSPDNPVNEPFDFDLDVMAAPGAGVPHTEWITLSRFQSTSGTMVAKLYEGVTLRSTVTVAIPVGTVPGQATTRTAFTFPAADLVAIAAGSWTTAGVLNVKTLTTAA